MSTLFCKFLSRRGSSKTLALSLVIFSSLAISACTTSKQMTPQQVTEAKNYTESFGVWEIKNCRVNASKLGLTLSSDGYLSDETLHVRLNSFETLKAAPRIRLTSWPHLFKLTGTGKTFSTEMPYHPAMVNRLWHAGSFLQVTYHPASAEKPLNAIFSTNGLPDALVAVNQQCHLRGR